jgi:undecaprenyl-diphosphatase
VPLIPPGLARSVRQFDDAADRAFGRLRGNAVADHVFYGASAIGEHGLVWMGLGGLLALRGRDRRRAGARVAAGIIVESLVVNGGVKSLFRRGRPVHEAPRPLPLRIPITSSFPSGHASAAFFAATLLSDGDPALAPVYWTLAVIVSVSRIHVKIHHASDVVGGMVVGAGLGMLAKRLVPLDRPDSDGDLSGAAGAAAGRPRRATAGRAGEAPVTGITRPAERLAPT